MITFSMPAEEDSPDLTDEQVAQAIVMPSVDAEIAHLRAMSCPIDTSTLLRDSHALRRRGAFFYDCITLSCCLDGTHKVEVVFRADWLLARSS